MRVDIHDETDLDHHLHGKQGVIVSTITDDAGSETGNPRDSRLYRVRFPDGEERDLRWHDLRPPF